MDQERPRRPALYADLTELIDAAGGEDISRSPVHVAASTAAAVLDLARAAETVDWFVGLAELIGFDTITALWHQGEPVSLARSLWCLHLIRHWCHSHPDEVVRLWAQGHASASADAVVAGVGDYPDADAVRRFADAVLTGACRGDFAVALERAAAFLRVVAVGRRHSVPPPGTGDDAGHGPAASDLADRNDSAARELTSAAAHWRAGTLA